MTREILSKSVAAVAKCSRAFALCVGVLLGIAGGGAIAQEPPLRPCTPSTTLTFSPNPQSGFAGDTRLYTGLVQNNDVGIGCTGEFYTLTFSDPAFLISTDFSPPVSDLVNGGNFSFTASITSLDSVVPGQYFVAFILDTLYNVTPSFPGGLYSYPGVLEYNVLERSAGTVPIAGTSALIGIGLIGFAAARRRKQ